jgi:hypothetical protein
MSHIKNQKSGKDLRNISQALISGLFLLLLISASGQFASAQQRKNTENSADQINPMKVC